MFIRKKDYLEMERQISESSKNIANLSIDKDLLKAHIDKLNEQIEELTKFNEDLHVQLDNVLNYINTKKEEDDRRAKEEEEKQVIAERQAKLVKEFLGPQKRIDL